MTRTVDSTATYFQNDSSMILQELLKYYQEHGADPIWAEVKDSFEGIIVRKPKVNWGREIRYTMCVDPGGGAMSGKLMQGGRFAPADKTRNIQGVINPKHQTVTYQFDNMMDIFTQGEANAYASSVKQEFDSKNSIFKTTMMLQLLGDGTSRQAQPIGFGSSDTSSGASFTVTDNTTPLRVKLSSAADAAGCSAWFAEGQVVSFFYNDRDLNDDGTDEAAVGAGKVRFLSLSFDDAGGGSATQYDAFRVVEIDQLNDAIYLWPARITGTIGNVDNEYGQYTGWVSGGTGAITVTPYRGRTVDGQLVATDTVLGAQINDINLVIGAALDTHAQCLMHPGYHAPTQAEARLQLGIGWSSATEMSSLSKYVPTGLHTLLCDRTHTVHGINRASVRQHLPTYHDNNGQELTFNTFNLALSTHQNRNHKDMTDWAVMYMNPLVASSLIALSEGSRIICEGDGLRGQKGKKLIVKNGTTYEFEDSSVMRKDKIYCIAKECMYLYDGNLRPVKFGGVELFPQLVSGNRVDVTEKYAKVLGEAVIKNPRRCMVIDNFKTSALR